MIQAGKLIHPIEIQREIERLEKSGEVKKSWRKIAEARAELLENALADEAKTDFGRIGREAISLRLRWYDVTLADRIVFRGSVYSITKLAEIGLRRGLEITAERFQK